MLYFGTLDKEAPTIDANRHDTELVNDSVYKLLQRDDGYLIVVSY